jgi:hypothetical protein
MPGERLDFLPHDFIELVFVLEEITENLFGYDQCASFSREIRQAFLAQPVHD